MKQEGGLRLGTRTAPQDATRRFGDEGGSPPDRDDPEDEDAMKETTTMDPINQHILERMREPIAAASPERTLSPEETAALAHCATNNLSVLVERYGTSRLHVLRVLARMNRGGRFLMLAATRKIAASMTAMGVETSTVHDALKWDPVERSFERALVDPFRVGMVVVEYADLLDSATLSRLMACSLGAIVVLTRSHGMAGSTILPSACDVFFEAEPFASEA